MVPLDASFVWREKRRGDRRKSRRVRVNGHAVSGTYWLAMLMQMKKAEIKQIDKVCCVACHESVPNFEIVSVGSIEQGYRDLCSRCFNTEMAQSGGLNGFEHLDLKPVTLTDGAGKEHEFHFRTHLLGTGVALDAFEIRGGHPAGYQFNVIGEPEEDLLVLLGKLIEKIRRGLSRRHLKKEKYGVQIADRIVCGTIEWDEAQDGFVPLLNIDGHEITWRDFGRMLMTFEGWQFKLEIRDKSEEF
jgi:hypothetical protein